MKKLLAIIVFATFMTSCNNSSSNVQPGSDSSSTKLESSSIDSMASVSDVSEGTMAMRNGKMQVMTRGKWELMSQPVTCSDQCQVLTNGQVMMKNGEKMMMKEGEMIDKQGHLIDPNGKMMENDKMEMKDSTK